jgi:hypothetical protein
MSNTVIGAVAVATIAAAIGCWLLFRWRHKRRQTAAT